MAGAKSNPLALVCGDDDFAVKQRAKQIFTQWSAELGGLVGLGASIDVATITSTTSAYLGAGTQVSAGRNVQVQAEAGKNVNSTTVAGAGALGAGVAGSVSIVNIGSPMSADGETASQGGNGESTGTVITNQIQGPDSSFQGF